MPRGEHDRGGRAAARQQQRERAAEQDQPRGLVAVEALHRDAAGAPGEVEPAVDRLAPRGADRGHHARAHERRHALEDPAQQRHAPAAVAVDAQPEPLDPGRGRAASGSPARPMPTATAASSPASAGRHVSTFVMPLDQHERDDVEGHGDREREQPGERGGQLAHDARRDRVDHQDRAGAHARHQVGGEDRAGEHRADLAQQVLAGLERLAELRQRAHGVAAGALLDDQRRHQHRHLARREPVAQALERGLQRHAEPRLLHHDAHLGRRRLGQLARGELHRAGHREARPRCRWRARARRRGAG